MLLIRCFTLLVAYFVYCSVADTDNANLKDDNEKMTGSELLEMLLDPAVYDPRIRPGEEEGKLTEVAVNIEIYSMGSIDEINMEYSMSLFLRQIWSDPRLERRGANKSLTLNYRLYDRLWVPDLFFRNDKESHFHLLTVPNRLIKIGPNGTILYSQRISLVLSCEMDLKNYPMDEQYCNMEFETYAYTADQLVFKWLDNGPLIIDKKISQPEYKLDRENVEIGDCSTKYITGTYSCKYARFHFVRMIKYHLIQTYIPTMLIVILSWVSFWIDADAVPARTSIGLLTVLSVATWSTGTASLQPRVSYIKAMDVWVTTCILFVSFALLEYALVNVLNRRTKKRKKSKTLELYIETQRVLAAVTNGMANGATGAKITEQDVKQANSSMQQLEDVKQATFPMQQELESMQESFISLRERIKTDKAYCVDVVSRILFPVIFAMFAFCYWLIHN